MGPNRARHPHPLAPAHHSHPIAVPPSRGVDRIGQLCAEAVQVVRAEDLRLHVGDMLHLKGLGRDQICYLFSSYLHPVDGG